MTMIDSDEEWVKWVELEGERLVQHEEMHRRFRCFVTRRELNQATKNYLDFKVGYEAADKQVVLDYLSDYHKRTYGEYSRASRVK